MAFPEPDKKDEVPWWPHTATAFLTASRADLTPRPNSSGRGAGGLGRPLPSPAVLEETPPFPRRLPADVVTTGPRLAGTRRTE